MGGLKGFEVQVESVLYLAGVEAPADRPFSFAYYLQVVNRSNHAVRLVGRKWVVEQEDGATFVMEGEGVSGRTPEVPAGGGFEFNSYHFVGRNAVARGALFCELENGRRFVSRVPDFRLSIPDWARSETAEN